MATTGIWTDILFALPEEATPFVQRLPREEARTLQNRLVYTSAKGALSVYISGTGSVATKMVTDYIVDKAVPQRLLICGFAGGLAAGLSPGVLILGDSVTNSKGEVLSADSRLLTTAESVRLPELVAMRGTIFTAHKVLGHSAEKKELAQHTDAVAVDMETFAAAQVAHAQSVPWMAIRVITDGVEDDLPLDFNAFSDASGNVDKTRILLATLTHPWKIPGLIRLGARSSHAANALAAFLAACLPLLPSDS